MGCKVSISSFCPYDNVRAFRLFLLLFCLVPQWGNAQRDTTIAISPVAIRGVRLAGVGRRLDSATLHAFTAHNVAEALRFLAGVQVKDYGGIGGLKTVNIRAMGSAHLGVTLDGAPLLHVQNGVIDLGRIALDDLEQVTIATDGNPATAWSSAREGSLGAQIYLQGAISRFREGKRRVIQARFVIGEFGLLEPQIAYQARLGQRARFALRGTLTEADGRYPFRYVGYNAQGKKVYDTTAIRHNGDVHRWRIESAGEGEWASGQWRLRLSTYHAEQGLPGAIVSNVWRRGERLETHDSFLQGSLLQHLTARYATRLVGKLGYTTTRYRQLDPLALHEELRYFERTAYFSWQHRYQAHPDWEATLAYDLEWAGLRAHDPERRQSPLTPPEPSRALHYLAARLGWQPGAWYCQAACHVVRGEGTRGHLLPSLSVRYMPIRPLTLFTYTRRSLRFPSFNELYYTGWGSAYLRPERVWQYALGAQWQGAGFELRSEGYYAVAEEKIIALPAGSQFRWRTFNLGKSHLWGIENACVVHYGLATAGRLTLRLQYTYSRAIDVSNPKDSYYRHQIPYIPRHSGSFTLSYVWRGLSLHCNSVYTGERYHQAENTVYNYEPPWYTTDLRLCYRFPIFVTTTELRLDVNNLFDQAYAVVLNYPMPGRNWRLSVALTL